MTGVVPADAVRKSSSRFETSCLYLCDLPTDGFSCSSSRVESDPEGMSQASLRGQELLTNALLAVVDGALQRAKLAKQDVDVQTTAHTEAGRASATVVGVRRGDAAGVTRVGRQTRTRKRLVLRGSRPRLEAEGKRSREHGGGRGDKGEDEGERGGQHGEKECEGERLRSGSEERRRRLMRRRKRKTSLYDVASAKGAT